MVIDNGFVHVGDVSMDGVFVRIDNCKNLRVWGTQRGMGQLRDGPLPETKADACGVVLVPFARVVFFMESTGW